MMTDQEKLADIRWRLSSLYYIVDKHGRKRLFQPNWAQTELLDSLWYCNVILKARQLGISTFICIFFLDQCLFKSTTSCGIIAHTREDAQKIFKRIKFAYDCLHPSIKASRHPVNDSATEIVFNNGSSISVGTSMRGSTLQYLHISEFGKICAKYPDKAEEIVTGSLNTVAPGQFIFIESTAEGKEGYFYDICKKAQQDRETGQKLDLLDFRFHFYPWWREPAYVLGSEHAIHQDHLEYFIALKEYGIELTPEQKMWYASRERVLGEKMKREYPSTPEEAWETSIQGTYYLTKVQQARLEGRIGHVPYDPKLPVHTAWDLGYNDLNTIIFFQVYGKEIRIIDYLEGSDESLSHWCGLIKGRGYHYGMHLAPHDIQVHEYTTGLTRLESAASFGIQLIPVPKMLIQEGIDAVRNLLHQCWINAIKCEKLIKCLENYRKEWDERAGVWKNRPRHDHFSHGADAMRVLATGLFYITSHKTQAQIERERLEGMRDESGLLPGSYLYTDVAKLNERTPYGRSGTFKGLI